ncbi:MAG TPA: DinB family protein [Bryobacteraceae bacterium]|nr:DinB family protein [Bryobacteraceae bacterium]
MSDRTELLERYRKGPELVAAVLTGAAGSELDWAPEGKWSIRQIVAHLADSEIVGTDRVRRTIAEDNPTLIRYDQDAWARALNYSKRKVSDALDILRKLRAENYELVSSLPPEAFSRPATHSEHGAMTLESIVETYAKHAEAHARQIRDVRERFKVERQRQAST